MSAMDLSGWLAHGPYSLERGVKQPKLRDALIELTKHHMSECSPYRNIMNGLNVELAGVQSIEDIPPLPVRLFKELDLVSGSREKVNKTVTSSGTTSQSVSRIALDAVTARHQMLVLGNIMTSFIGDRRLPMLVIDTPSVVSNRTVFTARGAGILGFSMFAREKVFALNDAMDLNVESVYDFLRQHRGQPVLVFGFTYMIWKHFYQALLSLGQTVDLSHGILIHGGGWKRLADQSVTAAEFRRGLDDVAGIKEIHDYYGMAEQAGSIFVECEMGVLHAPIYSDIIVRRTLDFSPAEMGESGIVQVVSILPWSYPGHVLLTEDEGRILGEDDCACGRLGKYFVIHGRLDMAEIRGCSDTYALSPVSR